MSLVVSPFGAVLGQIRRSGHTPYYSLQTAQRFPGILKPTPFRLGPFGGAVRSCGKSNRDLSKVSSSVHLNCRGLGGVLWVPSSIKGDHGRGKVRSSANTLRRLERLRGGGGCRFVVMQADDHTAIVSRIAYLGRPPHFRRLVDVFHRITESLPAA